ncbi:hypothetical protein CALVIDRAFT_564775 [Calocera viscosa TUFC12733]|uniref:F-box domain-containing protein n=1 Tax=Calocera viscosa (strain TUFC12733) TaxID=1330018 RepID=A0A167L5Y9_CALVF|nr:hypothetical protein CALVIDRAFT_564775 [Calocera viscosa TUFC12733]
MDNKRMHRFWLVPELVDQVLSELRATACGTLPALACTARFLHEPVLRQLHGRITHPRQLIGLLGGVWDGEERESSRLEVSTSAWLSRFDLRAQYVTQLDFAPHGMPLTRQASFYTYWSIMLRVHPAPVLPNLRSIAIAFWNPESFEFVLSLIMPTLTEVTALFTQVRTIRWHDAQAEGRPQEDGALRAGTLFRRIAEQGCELRTLRLWSLPAERELYEADLAHMLSLQRELTQVSVAGEFLSFHQALLVLAQCPRLHDLEVLKPALDWNESLVAFDALQQPNLRPGPLFPNLENLRVAAPARSVVRLLSVIDGNLRKLDLEMTPDLDVPILAKVSERVAQFSDSLEEFRLLGPYSQSGAHLPLPWEVFEPLLQCHKLTSLSICLHWWGELSIHDEDVIRLADALPRLQCLRIWTTVYPEEVNPMHQYLQPKPAPFTLSCLSALATSCPDIQLISLTGLDATGKSFILPDADPKRVPQQEVHFALRAAPLSSPPCVALYLQTLFPNAVLLPRYSTIDAGYSENKPYAPAWDLVAALMRYHRAAVLVEQGKATIEDAFERNDVPLRGGTRRMRIADMPPLV